MNPIWFLRMARWARNPPSEARVKLVLALIAVCLCIAGVEWLGLWPDWATADRMRP
ncbi:hypothetical protein [Aestuariivita sp.]|jgi:predicted acyltransferase|uniref:hypothetical protein n=1 Tax=Aestuariivita sp. TaxID=1872407 RepID=UPI0021729028|nr:hypothetical protein [Aestuariivita sp.]MCE8009841.1 hypothetical protein [Aestuariivita sp.]